MDGGRIKVPHAPQPPPPPVNSRRTTRQAVRHGTGTWAKYKKAIGQHVNVERQKELRTHSISSRILFNTLKPLRTDCFDFLCCCWLYHIHIVLLASSPLHRPPRQRRPQAQLSIILACSVEDLLFANYFAEFPCCGSRGKKDEPQQQPRRKKTSIELRGSLGLVTDSRRFIPIQSRLPFELGSGWKVVVVVHGTSRRRRRHNKFMGKGYFVVS